MKMEITLGADEAAAIAQVAEELGKDLETAIHELVLRGYGQWQNERSIQAMQRHSEEYRRVHPVSTGLQR